MKKLVLFIQAFCLTIGLEACDSGTPRQAQVQNSKLQTDTLAQQTKGTQEPSAAPDSVNGSDCTRGAAEPILKKSVFPKSTFRLLPDKISGLETTQLSNGDQLTIRNWGCEYYVLTFRFETSRFQADTTNAVFWCQKAASFMQDISKGIDAPLNIKAGLNSLKKRIKKLQRPDAKKLEIGEEIEYVPGDIRQFLTVGRIEKISNKKYAVEVSFAIGPL